MKCGNVTKTVTDETGGGIYLFLTDEIKQNGYVYSARPMLESNIYDNEYHTEINMFLSYTSKRLESEERRKIYHIQWDDEGYESVRPAQITGNLYCNGVLHDTIAITSENNWTYSVNNLDGAYSFTMGIDTGLRGYTVSIMEYEEQATTYIILKYNPSETPDIPPE